MLKITIQQNREKQVHEFKTETDALELLNNLIDDAIRLEKEYIEDIGEDDPITLEKIEELKQLDRNNIYILNWSSDLILGEYATVEIEEYSNYITDILKELNFKYDKSTMSKSIYVENNEGQLIRISDHKEAGQGSWMYRSIDINLVYKDGIINNEDINKYFNTNLEHERILL